ncbi:hypothetical protein GCM10009691_27930 [Brevibacterium picturae]|uniref:S-Me-THD-like C-terminal domain-containing protein n=2 Tax=Brevibacterium picturae TaxID=260553 RepID=A0ABN2C7X1_9MICO
MTGQQAKASLVPGTLSRCLEVGATVRRARASESDVTGEVARQLGGRVLFSGTVTDLERGTRDGFAKGWVSITGTDANTSESAVVEFQNENLLAYQNGVPVATTPDLIIVLDSESAGPITTEDLRYGQRVQVIAAPCDPRWHSEAGLAFVGPAGFGYEQESVRWNASVGETPPAIPVVAEDVDTA